MNNIRTKKTITVRYSQ